LEAVFAVEVVFAWAFAGALAFAVLLTDFLTDFFVPLLAVPLLAVLAGAAVVLATFGAGAGVV